MLFKRNGWYYLYYGPTCCFCRFGSGAELFTAKSPLGPWTDMKIDLNPKKLHSMNRTVPTQNSYVFQAILKDGSTAFFAAGDMWSLAEDNLKSHDLQYWQQLEFDDSTSPPSIKPFVWQDSITIDLL